MNPFVCGSFGSQTEYDDGMEELLSPRSTMRRTTRKSKDSKNPYADRGLDKFYAVLAELEDKKQKIYTQKGSGDISLVRFVYSTSNDWKPIVVKVKKGRKQQQNVVREKKTNTNTNGNSGLISAGHNSVPVLLDKYPIDTTASTSSGGARKLEVGGTSQKNPINEIFHNNYWRRRLNNIVGDMRRPCVYMPLMIILILFFLAIYGKAFAVVCTSVGWYLVPPMITAATKDGGGAAGSYSCPTPSKGPKKIHHLNNNKKEYARRFSEKSIVRDRDRDRDLDGSSSPKSVLVAPPDHHRSPGKHSHKQSW